MPSRRRSLLLEALEEVDRLPQRARRVAKVVMRVRTLERGERARHRPIVPVPGRRPAPAPRDSTDNACQLRSVTSERFIAPFTLSTAMNTSPLRSLPAAHSAVAQKSLASSEKAISSGVRTGRSTIASSNARLAATTRSVGVLALSSRSSSTSIVVGLTPRSESSPRATLSSSSGRRLFGYAPGSGPDVGTAEAPMSSPRSCGVTSGQSTGRTMHVSCVAARNPAMTPKTGARCSAPSSSTGNGSARASSAFPTAMTSSHTSLSVR